MKMVKNFILLFLPFCIMTDGFSQKDTISAQYPGGVAAWTSYIMKSLSSSNGHTGIKGKYMVTVKFTVDKFGNVSTVRALNDPGNLGGAIEKRNGCSSQKIKYY